MSKKLHDSTVARDDRYEDSLSTCAVIPHFRDDKNKPSIIYIGVKKTNLSFQNTKELKELKKAGSYLLSQLVSLTSTIGLDELNFRVRNGNGCFLISIATSQNKEFFITKQESSLLN